MIRTLCILLISILFLSAQEKSPKIPPISNCVTFAPK